MIDAHIHILPPRRLAGAVRWIKRVIPGLDIDQSIDQATILAMLKQAGVTCFFNYVYPLHPEESRSLNQFNYQLSRQVDGAVCFGSVHPENDAALDIVDQAINEYGLIGLKFHPFVQGFDLSHPKMDAIYRAMSQYGRPIVLHTGFEKFYKRRLPASDVEKLLRKYPDLVLVICHLFYPRIADAFRLLDDHPNLYLDVSNLMSGYQEPLEGENLFQGVPVTKNGREVYGIFLDHNLDELEKNSARIMFGTDFPVGMNSLRQMYDCVRGLPISSEAFNDLTHNTALRFMKRFLPPGREIRDMHGRLMVEAKDQH